ncbi:transporter [Caulobacter sp. S45]|uniref:SphA family protein n=1 Tax=Caulobacter sp. S45 TaxID=1641861 RepID=UPI00131A6423|nr:transporter [Caulobacter sp. S45]
MTTKVRARLSLSAAGVLASMLTIWGSPASAAQKSSLPAFPPGLTIGTAAGTIPPDPGIYLTEKTFYTSIQVVDGNGHDTGAHINSYATIPIVQIVPGWKVLGADYAFQFDSYGIFDAKIKFPAAAHLPSYNTVGASDLAIRPIILSWKLPDHLFFAIREGVYVPVGTYDPIRPLSISHNRYTFEQGLALSYVEKNKWVLSANGVIDVNANNPSTLLNGVDVKYRSGSTYNVDLTALRAIGRLQVGPVGYYYHQFSSDVGPAALNQGVPTEGAAGMLIGYTFPKVYVNVYAVQDISARNVGKQSRFWFTIALPIL